MRIALIPYAGFCQIWSYKSSHSDTTVSIHNLVAPRNLRLRDSIQRAIYKLLHTDTIHVCIV